MQSLPDALKALREQLGSSGRMIETRMEADVRHREIAREQQIARDCRLVGGAVPPALVETNWDSYDENWSQSSLAAATKAKTWDPSAKPMAVLFGRSGVGKTHVATAMWKQHHQVGALWLHVPSFCERIRPFDFELKVRAMSIVASAPLVLFDDLGAEIPDDRSRVRLEMLITGRYRNQKPQLITTNLGQRSLQDWSERVLDRMLSQTTHRIIFDDNAPSYRRKGPR